MNPWIQLCSCPNERLLLSVRHDPHHAVAREACRVEVLLSVLDGTSEDRVVHRGRLRHGRHLSWVVRWLDEVTFVVQLFGGDVARYRLNGDGADRVEG